AGKKATKVDESQVLDNGRQDDQVTRSEFKGLLQQERQTEHINSMNSFKIVSSPVNTSGPSFVNAASPLLINAAATPVGTNAFEEHPFERFSPFKNAFSLLHVPIVTPINDTGIFGNAYDDETVEEDVDMNNVVSSYTILDAPLTKFLKDHPKDQVIGSIETPIQTRQMTKINKEHGLISLVQKLWRTNYKDFQNCLFACYLSQMEPKKPVQALKDPTRIKAIRLFLAYASFKDFVVYQMDVKSAFLYEKTEDEVYVCEPHGFKDPASPDKVYKVEKALYRQYQAPRAWKKLSTEFESLMHDKFQMSSMGEYSFFLGLQVQQKSNGIFINQDKYVADILKKFDFSTIKTTSTPIEPNKALVKDTEAKDVDVHLYRLMIRLLMYLTVSRPDITFAVCACARFYVTSKTSHLHAVKRIFRYLKGVGDRMEMATTTASSLKAEQGSGNINRTPSMATLNEPLPQGTGSEKPSESKGFEQIIDFLNAKSIRYALTMILTVHASCVKQFWTFIKVKKVNGQEQIQALVDKQKIIITEECIKHDLKFDDAEEEAGKGSGLHTDSHHTPTNTQLSSSKSQKKIKPKRNQRQATKVHSPSSEIPVKESIPSHSNDPLLSSEDSIQRNELMIFCTNLQQQGRMQDANMFRVDDLEGNEVIVDVREKIVKKEVTTADPVTTVGEVVTAASVEDSVAPTTATTTNVDDELTLVTNSMEKDEVNKAMIEEWDDVQATIDADMQRKYFAAKRAEEIRNKPATKKMFDKVYKRVNTFMDMNTKNVEESLKKTQAEVTEGSSKRAGQELEQESAKKQKLAKQEQVKLADFDTT
nr:retrovirus-related Pol polyprotein from transposon TNT 1-94 [Tanacetum cinerariifolium]